MFASILCSLAGTNWKFSKISWSSKTGAIAYATNTSSIGITFLACADGENWDFAPSYKINPTDVNGEAHPISFLSWNPLGTDLACIDLLGNISIHTQSNNQLGGFNCHFNPSPPSNAQSPQELNSVIGFRWFEPDKNIFIANPATLVPSFEQYMRNPSASNSQTNQIANYSYFQTRQYGPYLPVIPSQQKQACIALTQRGTIRLLTQGISDARYFEVSSSLDKNGLGEPVLFTHASFAGCKDNSLLLSAYSSYNETLYIYKLNLEWPALAAAANRSPNQNKTSNHIATIGVKRLLQTKITPQVNNSHYLSHLLMVPAGLQNSDSHIDAEIHIAFSSGKNDSVVQKFDVVTKTVSLHNNFYSLNYRRDSLGGVEETQTSLIPGKPVRHQKPIINLSALNFDSFICTSFADGTVDMKQQPQFINPKSQNSPISLLTSIGFQLPPQDLVTDMCVSQNLSSALYFDGEDKLCISYMRNSKLMPIPPSKQTAHQLKQSNIIMTVSAIALAVRHSASCFANTSGDDLIIVMKRELDRLYSISPETADQFLQLLLRESYRAVVFSLDVGKEMQVDKIIVNPSLQRLLSMQATLGTSLDWKRNATGRMAWGILNLRILAFAFTFTLRAVNQSRQYTNGQSEIEFKAGYFLSMAGLSRWCIDLMAYICQDLYLASIEADPFSYFKNKSSVAGAILLGKVPRMFLIYSLRAIRGLDLIASKLAEQEPNAFSGSAHVAHRKLKEISQHYSPVSLEFFEKLTSDVDNSLNAFYPNLQDRLQVEHDLIFNAKIPDNLSTVLTRTVEMFSRHLKPKINISWLYFYDVTWLGLNEQDKGEASPNGANNEGLSIPVSMHSHVGGRRLSLTLQSQATPERKAPDGSLIFQPKPTPSGGQEIDYLRKQEMSKYSVGIGTRCRCSRCGEISIWYNPKTQNSAYWTIACQKACICGGGWIPLE